MLLNLNVIPWIPQRSFFNFLLLFRFKLKWSFLFRYRLIPLDSAVNFSRIEMGSCTVPLNVSDFVHNIDTSEEDKEIPWQPEGTRPTSEPPATFAPLPTEVSFTVKIKFNEFSI